jgi:lipopolysaccharide transport system ATP-binding protein
MRLDWINQTSLRNDIELFSFSTDTDAAGFGKGGVAIERVCFTDEVGNPLAWVVGGELIQLHIECSVRQPLFSPIVGFMVKDRLGQIVFADNTYLIYAHNPVNVDLGERLNAVFHFTMPVMPVGDYSVAVAVAEGTQSEHIQHQWLHDALVFKVQSSSVCHGLIGRHWFSLTNLQHIEFMRSLDLIFAF